MSSLGAEPVASFSEPPAAASPSEFRKLPWRERLAFSVDTMREISRQTDPEKMVELYAKRMRRVMPSDGFISLSRRKMPAGHVRVTRSTLFIEKLNPWKFADRLPVLTSGLLVDLIYGNEPVVIDALDVPADDPGRAFFGANRSLVAIPLFDGGEAVNMVILLRAAPAAFDRESLPEHVWLSNLFGRATNNLVLSNKVRQAYDALDRELHAVAEIQRSLLPTKLPEIPGLDVAAYYQTSRRAGGDYYDFFPLPDGRWGILMADVSGHGTPAAVLMAITHSIAHTFADPKSPPGDLLAFVNQRLALAYTNGTGNFVTAFYAVWDPARRQLTYSSAGHPCPRLRKADGAIVDLDGDHGLPLGILEVELFPNNVRELGSGDTLVLYTDGITEARDRRGDMYELERLDSAVAMHAGSRGDAEAVMAGLLNDLADFADGCPPGDDRTLLVARVR